MDVLGDLEVKCLAAAHAAGRRRDGQRREAAATDEESVARLQLTTPAGG